MARYIDVEKAIEEARLAHCKKCDSINGQMCIRCQFDDAMDLIEATPTADVVPKSEVDSEIKVWQEFYADTVSKWEKAYEELEIKLENVKASKPRLRGRFLRRLNERVLTLLAIFTLEQLTEHLPNSKRNTRRIRHERFTRS